MHSVELYSMTNVILASVLSVALGVCGFFLGNLYREFNKLVDKVNTITDKLNTHVTLFENLIEQQKERINRQEDRFERWRDEHGERRGA